MYGTWGLKHGQGRIIRCLGHILISPCSIFLNKYLNYHMGHIYGIFGLYGGTFVTIGMVYMIRMGLRECTILRGREKRALGPK